MLYYLPHSIVSSIFVGTRGNYACLNFFGYIFVGTRGDRSWLYFLFLDWYLRSHGEIVLAFHFCFCIDIRSMTLSSDHSLLAQVTGVSALLPHFGWDDQSHYFLVPVRYRCTVSTWSRRWWSLCLTYIAKLLLCSFPVEIRSWFSAVTRERWFWSTW